MIRNLCFQVFFKLKMVVNKHFQELLDCLDKDTPFNLPSSKGTALTIEFGSTDNISPSKALNKAQDPKLPFAASEIFNADIKEGRRLTAVDDNCKAVYEITFDITNSNFKFQPGDTIGILPQNKKSNVDIIINQLDLIDVVDLNYVLNVDSGQKGAKIPTHIPIKSTIRHVLTHCVALTGIVKKLFLIALSRYTKDESEKKILEYLCSREGSEAYTTHILNKHICILDLFILFKSCKPPTVVLLEHLPRLLPRPYSIVNRQNDEKIIKICFSVIDIGNRKGITTGWLEECIIRDIEKQMENLSLNKCTKILIYLRKNINGFCLPNNHETPIILIGPGTGVSPYIGFLEEREFLKKIQPNGNFGEVWLFYGCRNSKLDFIYKEELKYFESQGVLTKLCTAFSREEDSEIHYVQDAIVKNAEKLTELIRQGAHIYVCGDIKVMATRAKEAIVQCIEKYDLKSKEDAENYILNMQKDNRYLTDIWN